MPAEAQRNSKTAFREATKVLSENGVTQQMIANAFGLSLNLIAQWNMAGSRRYPREGWEGVLAALCEREADKGVSDAEERADALHEQAGRLYAERNERAAR